MCGCCQRLDRSTSVELEVAKLTQTATLQAAPTAKDRKLDPKKKETTTKVCQKYTYDDIGPGFKIKFVRSGYN